MVDVLVVAAHPDDEILGCGGTIARHASEGDRVHVLILAEGITSRDPERDRGRSASALSDLRGAAQEASRAVNAASLTLGDFPDNRMDSVNLLDVVKVVEEHIAKRKPSIVYTHHGGDLNVDHRRTHQAVVTACRPQPGSTVRSLLFFEVASSTEYQTDPAFPFVPNWYVDISKTLAKKKKALKLYASEMRRWPHARSIEALEHLAGWRGASVGVPAAEAFMLGRGIR